MHVNIIIIFTTNYIILYLYLYIYFLIYHIILIVLIYLPKTKKFGCVGMGDLTSLFKSCEIDRSQGRLV